ncbi:hypothetical protein BO85DRAFT_510746 [Aspergillus piperis CBS 112811]|uniref:Uncharacterized protein n=1 Tax=Aspergillus piperis CBS 112811 TaxID=1448313 RepID=A0A8G1R542_9EURO|nr:hypothetical protein BO85DRAFT_510746 [Aspergillus piperis CBS 112811]RAH59743.1 hypothetical protein BO85DRAFT_510746 [Aspergillus piperis CBS 112811]
MVQSTYSPVLGTNLRCALRPSPKSRDFVRSLAPFRPATTVERISQMYALSSMLSKALDDLPMSVGTGMLCLLSALVWVRFLGSEPGKLPQDSRKCSPKYYKYYHVLPDMRS